MFVFLLVDGHMKLFLPFDHYRAAVNARVQAFVWCAVYEVFNFSLTSLTFMLALLVGSEVAFSVRLTCSLLMVAVMNISSCVVVHSVPSFWKMFI